jgi:hypothetical protein
LVQVTSTPGPASTVAPSMASVPAPVTVDVLATVKVPPRRVRVAPEEIE